MWSKIKKIFLYTLREDIPNWQQHFFGVIYLILFWIFVFIFIFLGSYIFEFPPLDENPSFEDAISIEW